MNALQLFYHGGDNDNAMCLMNLIMCRGFCELLTPVCITSRIRCRPKQKLHSLPLLTRHFCDSQVS